MFTKAFTRERHIEELRAELRGTLDPQEAQEIRAELQAHFREADSFNEDEA